MARTIPTWLNAFAMPKDEKTLMQTAPTRLQLLKMTIDGYFEKTPRGHFKMDTGEKKSLPWEFVDIGDIGLIILGTKMAKQEGDYTPTTHYQQYIEGIKKCHVNSLGKPSTIASLEDVGYPPYMLKVYTGPNVYTFKLAFIDHHYPVGPVVIQDSNKPTNDREDICLCDGNGGIYINYATMTLFWQHRAFALCLIGQAQALEEHEYAFVAQIQPKGTKATKDAKTVDVPYCITGTDGLEMMHSHYTIP